MAAIKLDESEIIAIIEQHLIQKYKRAPKRISLFHRETSKNGDLMGALIVLD